MTVSTRPLHFIQSIPGLFCVAACAAGLAWLATAGVRPQPYVSSFDNVLGTSLDLTILAASDDVAAAAETAVLASFDRDASVLSAYDPSSEFSRWAATQDVAVPASTELVEVLGLFDRWRERTSGALDPSVERVSRVWAAAAGLGAVPSTVELERAVADVRQPHWRIDADAATITRLSTTPLILNSFTKSYIVDRAARAALSAGASGVVVNVGGDIVVRGDWTEQVAVRDPRAPTDNGAPFAQLTIRDRAVATSGGYRRGFDIAGRHYSHIVDPRTGQPAGHVLSATVVSPNAVDAGALATAMCVLTPEESVRLASMVPGAEFVIVLADGRRVESARWQAIESPAINATPAPTAVATLYAAEQAKPAFDLTVTLDLARPGGRARRPYVAVWVEDKDHRHVRTLALWIARPRWLPDLRAWNRADRARAAAEGTEIVRSVSSATRAPGQHTLSWDGTNQEGRAVATGTYTVFIEAAREHGTYQLMRQDVEVGGAARHVDLTGNAEVIAASVDYKGGR